MSLLVRRINRAKWEQIVDTGIDKDGSADAITNCLKTDHNDLSVWHIESDTDLEKAILALITGPSQTKLCTLHVVIIDESIVSTNGLSLVKTKGDTVVKDLVNTYKDLTNLTYEKLGIVKDLIVDSIKDERATFYTKKKLQEIIKKALNEGIVNKVDLNQDLILSEKL